MLLPSHKLPLDWLPNPLPAIDSELSDPIDEVLIPPLTPLQPQSPPELLFGDGSHGFVRIRHRTLGDPVSRVVEDPKPSGCGTDRGLRPESRKLVRIWRRPSMPVASGARNRGCGDGGCFTRCGVLPADLGRSLPMGSILCRGVLGVLSSLLRGMSAPQLMVRPSFSFLDFLRERPMCTSTQRMSFIVLAGCFQVLSAGEDS